MKKILGGVILLIGILLIGSFIFRGDFAFISPISDSIEQSPFFKTSIPIYVPSSLSLNKIFTDDHSFMATLSAERKRVLIATGDVIPARVVNITATKKNDFKWAFAETADELKKGDITFIDLESPLISDCPLVNTGFKFCGDEQHVEGLVSAGVDMASLANNHAGNYGITGVENTSDLLNENNILVTGRDGAVYKNIRGVKFAFLGYNDIGGSEAGIEWADTEAMKKEIGEAKKRADVVVVAIHWGVEYTSQPSKERIDLAHMIIDSGADLVIGNHPHWIQPVEVYKDKLIVYAHGNFIFDQEWSKKTKTGVVGKYTFYDDSLIDAQFMPIFIEDWGQPHFTSGAGKEKVLSDMEKESEVLARDIKQNK